MTTSRMHTCTNLSPVHESPAADAEGLEASILRGMLLINSSAILGPRAAVERYTAPFEDEACILKRFNSDEILINSQIFVLASDASEDSAVSNQTLRGTIHYLTFMQMPSAQCSHRAANPAICIFSRMHCFRGRSNNPDMLQAGKLQQTSYWMWLMPLNQR